MNLKKIVEDRAWSLVALATAALAGLVQLIAQRGAAAGWHKVRGSYPEELD
jgi:hypothetical protein